MLTESIQGSSPPVVKSVGQLLQGVIRKLVDESKLETVSDEARKCSHLSRMLAHCAALLQPTA